MLSVDMSIIHSCTITAFTCLYFTYTGELQTVLCVGFSSADTLYTGTLSGDVYQWKGVNLHNVIKGAHNVKIYCLLTLNH